MDDADDLVLFHDVSVIRSTASALLPTQYSSRADARLAESHMRLMAAMLRSWEFDVTGAPE